MNRCQKLILAILKKSLSENDYRININEYKDINWLDLYNESKQHDISGLIYFFIDKGTRSKTNNNIWGKWRKQVILSNITQIYRINKIQCIIDDLQKQSIQVILLKGLILRKFYPKPELRSMSDADILVKKEYYDKVKRYLLSKGYVKQNCSNDIHESFISKDNIVIELHSKLINNDFIKFDTKEFEESLWKNSIKSTINNVTCNTLSVEDFIIHLCFHMAVHEKYNGFGIKQLYDLAIYIKYNSKDINWNRLINNISNYQLLKFSKGLFILINKLFNIEIPDNVLNNHNIKEQDINLLLESILYSSVHGRKVADNIYIDNSINKMNINNYIKFIFPDLEYMSTRYKCVRKNKLLLPVAWIYRIIKSSIEARNVRNKINYAILSLRKGSMRFEIIKIFEL